MGHEIAGVVSAVDEGVTDLREGQRVEEAATPAQLGATNGRGVDVAVEFTGNAEVARGGLRSLTPGGKLMIVAINLRSFEFNPFADLLVRERHIIGCSDHTRAELVELLDLAARGAVDLSRAITRTVPLEAEAVNGVLDDLERGSGHLRTVIAVR